MRLFNDLLSFESTTTSLTALQLGISFYIPLLIIYKKSRDVKLKNFNRAKIHSRKRISPDTFDYVTSFTASNIQDLFNIFQPFPRY